MRRACAGCLAVVAALGLACGGRECGDGTEEVDGQCVVADPPGDPLVGFWTYETEFASGRCTFYSTGEWSCPPWQNGWPLRWAKLGDDWYVFSFGNGMPCDGRATFTQDLATVSILMNCNAADSFRDGRTFVLHRTP